MKMMAMAAATILATASGAASAADLGGSWVVRADFGGAARYTFVCTFKSDGKGFQGPCASVRGRVLPTTGSRDAHRMRLKYSSDYNGSGLEQDFSGDVRPDGGVQGEVKNRLSSGDFGGAPLTNDQDLNPQAWRFQVGFSDDIRFDLVCSLKTDGGRLKGPCGIADGAVLDTRGEADGSDVSFAYDTQVQGQPLHASYAGTIQPDGSLKGSVKAGDTAGTFTARRP